MKEPAGAQIKEKAEEHWKFLESWLHRIFVDAFLHGYKHGIEEEQDEQ